jgi:predicted metal-dependent hydrolase
MIDAQTAVDEARRLFNEGKYWHVHEALEAVWLVRQGEEKTLLQGLIMAAASLVHLEKDHVDVAWRMMNQALQRLEGKPSPYHGWDIEAFRAHLRGCIQHRAWSGTRV